MRNVPTGFRYRLGIDVGVASLGIAILAFKDNIDPETGEPEYDITGGAVRTYPIPEGAEERRNKRSMRRNTERRKRRLDRLSDLLCRNGIGFPRQEMPKELLELSPIKLRAMASREKVPLAHLSRALLHMARHRGSSAIRESDIKDDGKESRQTAEGIDTLRREIKRLKFCTYGQYLRWREKQDLPIRINQEKMANSKGGYAFYPSREMLIEEFEIIWTKQAECYPRILTDTLKKEVCNELFFQRTVTAPPPGKCSYFTREDRLPKASRLFQIRRIYEETNHLRFYDKQGHPVSYELEQRDAIITRLMAGEDLSMADVKKTLGLNRTDKATIEDADGESGRKITGYPFDLAFGDIPGSRWTQITEGEQDEILRILASVHDDGRAAEELQKAIPCDPETARRVLQAKLPSGYGRMGLSATTKILEELKKDVIPARNAESNAGLIHATAPDGVIYDQLPYYGKILVGHTVSPMWVSDYRRDSDTPPDTDHNEQEHGRIPNPVVHLALNQIQKTVNAVIRRYGIPHSIHIELARELNKGAEERERIASEQKANQKATEQIKKELEEHGVTINRLNIQKHKLWKEQGCLCVYTGKTIQLSELYSGYVDVDHILPRSKTFSDSMANKVVCLRSANADKSNRPPFEAFSDNDKYDWVGITRRVEKLPDIKKWCSKTQQWVKRPNNKKWRFRADAMKAFEDEGAFRARYGNDNSYIARVAAQFLRCLYAGQPHRVIAVSSHIVGMLRGKWGLQNILGSRKDGKKARDDHRHHFIDALVTACATRGMVQRIQREAARCERNDLEDFVEHILPPFGDSKRFFNAAKKATLERVTLSRKADHSTDGQLHEDTLLGIVGDEPDKNGRYVCRKRRKIRDYNTLEALEKSKIEKNLPDLDEINKARDELDAIKDSLRSLACQAGQKLEEERRADIAAGGKGKAVSNPAIFSGAVELHKNSGGKMIFTIFVKQKLVNIRRSFHGNRLTGGYISGRNHRKDFYLDNGGKLRWQLITMLEANDKLFAPESEKTGNTLLWSAHKEDVLLMDNPDNPEQRIQVVVAKFNDTKMGVVPASDARDSKNRILWERRLKFFQDHHTRRIVTDALGGITWYFPVLPRSEKTEPAK